MFCPVDCAECFRPECTHGYCDISGERVFSTCEECGLPGVSVARIYICVDCTFEPSESSE